MQGTQKPAPLKVHVDTALGAGTLLIDVIPLDAETVTASLTYKLGIMPSQTKEQQISKADALAFAQLIIDAAGECDQ